MATYSDLLILPFLPCFSGDDETFVICTTRGSTRVKKSSKSTTSSTRASARSGAKRKTSSTSRSPKSSPKSSSTSAKKRTGLNSKPKKSTRTTAPKKSSVRSAKLNSTTKGKSASSQDPIVFPEEKKKIPKTHLTAKELRRFKAMLLGKRAELAGDVQRLTDEALKRTNNGADDHSSMPIHMADVGSDNWEQDFTLGLIANEEALVHEIDDALERIQNKTYGICIATHHPISNARLEAKPWAKYCIDYARAREEGRAP